MLITYISPISSGFVSDNDDRVEQSLWTTPRINKCCHGYTLQDDSMARTFDRDLHSTRPQSQRSTFSFNRRARPPPLDAAAPGEEQVPLGQSLLQNTSQLGRKASKGGLRSIFTRNKTQGPSTAVCSVAETLEVGIQQSEGPASKDQGLSKEAILAMRKIQHHMLPPATPQKEPGLVAKSSRMTMRTKASTSAKPSHSKMKPSATTSSPKSSQSVPRRSDAAWDPPPLFQAYPQSIKHATLLASTLSADAILRISSLKKHSNNVADPAKLSTDTSEEKMKIKKTEKTRSKHRRQLSGSISKAAWTHKIFVLVTSGYLLQYAGEGSFDRLPEKMMPLGKDSVAFASDVIPGKHWVLQISQAMDAEGTPSPAPQSLMSRLTFRGADYRRSATSLLLVLNSAEDLESWLMTVRREIESLGGKKHSSETGKPKAGESILQLKALPSPRFVVRDPDRFSGPPTPKDSSFGISAAHSMSFDPYWNQPLSPTHTISSTNAPTSPVRRVPLDALSMRTNSTSHDGRQLNSLRNNTHRLSYMSSGQRTTITSGNSSATTSPTKEDFPSLDMVRTASNQLEDVRPRPNATAISERRRSMQQLHNTVPNQYTFQKSLKPRPHSTYAPCKNQHQLIATPPSMPEHILPEMEPLMLSASSTDLAATEVTTTRRSEPVEHTLTEPSPASMNDTTSQPRHPVVYTPAESSFRMVPQARASIIEIPSKFQTSLGSDAEPKQIARRASMVISSPAPKDDSQAYRLPRRYSSFQTFQPRPDCYEAMPEYDVSPWLTTVTTTLTIPEPLTPTSPAPRTPLESFIPTPPTSRSCTTPRGSSMLDRVPNTATKYTQLQRTITSMVASRSPRPTRTRSPMSYPAPHSASSYTSVASLKPVLTPSSVKSGPPISMLTKSQAPIRRGSGQKALTPPPSSLQRPLAHFSRVKPPQTSSLFNAPSGGSVVSPSTIQTIPDSAHRSRQKQTSHLVLPSFKHLKESAGPNSLVGRRSTSLLSNVVKGPPPAPPPNCALPALPRGNNSRTMINADANNAE